jgi:hypothetical protein
LATAITVAGKVLFTTYTPSENSDGSVCRTPELGKAQVYALDIYNANPITDFDDSGAVSGLSDRKLQLEREGMAAGVSIIYPNLKGVSPKAIIGTEILPIKFDDPVIPTYWFEDRIY